MINFENTEVVGWEHAIRGMRNPMNSWEKSDSEFPLICDDITNSCKTCPHYIDNGTVESKCDMMGNSVVFIGPNDQKLMMSLAKGGSVHAKYRRMIVVYADITAPLYWWKEFDTYKVGTVMNSCSTMHKIHEKEFTIDGFSHEHILDNNMLWLVVGELNEWRTKYLETKDKKYWWQMIQLLPSSYNQKRTVMLNYEVLVNIYQSRKDHKLDEWRAFCKWIESLPYAELITGEADGEENQNA